MPARCQFEFGSDRWFPQAAIRQLHLYIVVQLRDLFVQNRGLVPVRPDSYHLVGNNSASHLESSINCPGLVRFRGNLDPRAVSPADTLMFREL